MNYLERVNLITNTIENFTLLALLEIKRIKSCLKIACYFQTTPKLHKHISN